MTLAILIGAALMAASGLAVAGGSMLLLGMHEGPLYLQDACLFSFLVFIGPHVIYVASKLNALFGWIAKRLGWVL